MNPRPRFRPKTMAQWTAGILIVLAALAAGGCSSPSHKPDAVTDQEYNYVLGYGDNATLSLLAAGWAPVAKQFTAPDPKTGKSSKWVLLYAHCERLEERSTCIKRSRQPLNPVVVRDLLAAPASGKVDVDPNARVLVDGGDAMRDNRHGYQCLSINQFVGASVRSLPNLVTQYRPGFYTGVPSDTTYFDCTVH